MSSGVGGTKGATEQPHTFCEHIGGAVGQMGAPLNKIWETMLR